MEDAKIYCASHKGLSGDTKRSMEQSGYPYDVILGISDTALARNITLTRALRSKDAESVVLMMDDDMQVPGACARKLVELALKHRCPVSATYLTADRRVAAYQFEPQDKSDVGDWTTCKWVTGLGCLAIPRECLEALSKKSVLLASKDATGEDIISFCWSGPGSLENGGPLQWISEDYSLTHRLGGVLLSPVGVGHQKLHAMWPDEETLRRVQCGGKEIERGRDEPSAKPNAPHS